MSESENLKQQIEKLTDELIANVTHIPSQADGSLKIPNEYFATRFVEAVVALIQGDSDV